MLLEPVRMPIPAQEAVGLPVDIPRLALVGMSISGLATQLPDIDRLLCTLLLLSVQLRQQ